MGKYSQLGKNTVLVFVGNAGSKLIGLLMLPFYTRFLSVDDYGTTDIINIYVTFLLSIVSCCIAESIFVFPKGQSSEKQCEYLSSGCAFSVIALLLAGIIFKIVSMLADYYSIENSFIQNLWLIYVLLIAQLWQQLFQQFTRSIDRIVIFSVAGIVLTVCTVLFSFFLIPRYGVAGFVFSLVLANVGAAAYSLLGSGAYRYLSLAAIRWNCCKEMLRYSVPLIPNGIMWWLVSALNRPVMEFYLGMEAIGLFAVANKFPSVFSSVFSVFAVSWQISVMEEYGKEDYSQFFNKVFRSVILLMILSSCLISIFSPLIISILADKNYYESWKYVPILSLSSVFMAISGMAGSNFSATKESKYFFYSSVWGALAAVIANVLFIPYIGIMGACLSVVFSFLVMSLSRCFYCWRYVKIRHISRIVFSLAGNIIIVMLILSSLSLLWKIAGYCLSFIFLLYVNRDVLKGVCNVIKKRI